MYLDGIWSYSIHISEEGLLYAPDVRLLYGIAASIKIGK